MEYVTLKIGTPARPVVYEKDFGVADVFGSFVKTTVSDLVRLGFLKDGQRYHATITPGQDDQPQFEQVVFEPEPDVAIPNRPEHRWLTLKFRQDTSYERPMQYFTLEVHTIAPEPRLYRKDFPLKEVDALISRVKTTLQQMGVTRSGETVQADLFARLGDAPIFDRERITLPEELSDFEIHVQPLAVEEEFPEQPMPTCSCGDVAEQAVASPVIFFREEPLQRLSEHVRLTATRSQESGGILIGEVYRRPDSRGLYIIIQDYIPAQQTKADAISLRFTHETWQELQARKRELFGESKRVIGWYHTHPPIPVTVGERELRTVQFFSADDLAVHRQIFKKPWQVALVMDAESRERIFFRWDGNSVVDTGYHVCT